MSKNFKIVVLQNYGIGGGKKIDQKEDVFYHASTSIGLNEAVHSHTINMLIFIHIVYIH